MSEKKLTPLESIIMDQVWERYPVTVREVHEVIQKVRPMAYNTVLTMMRLLRDKEVLSSERQGRMDVYTPLVTREQAARKNLSEMLDRFFLGSARALVSQLLDSGELSVEEIRAIRKEVDAKLREQTRD